MTSLRTTRAPVTDRIPFFLGCIAIFFVMFFAFHDLSVFAEEIGNGGFPITDDDSLTPWHISADEIQYHQQTDHYIGSGRVVITRNDRTLTADFVRFDRNRMQVYADGHVLLIAGNDSLIADRLDMDLNSETGTAYNATLFFKANHFYIQGDVIHKIGKESYQVKKATITTCDGKHPDWKITGRNLKVTIDGFGTAWNSVLWAREVPIAYTPFIVFPAKSKRQSGFLVPRFGYSDRKGIEYEQPFFWAISPCSDATFYTHYMEERGLKTGMEYRYMLSETSRGTGMVDFLEDWKIDDGTEDSSSKWGYEDDDAFRPNSDRYWFRMKSDHDLPGGFAAKLDLDVVSDQDYLQEFRDGYTGFNQAEKYFIKTFARDLDDYDDSVRVNRLNVNKIWTQFSLNAEVRWYDDVVARRLRDTDETLQKLPFIEFDGVKQQILNTPFYFDLESEYVYFFRQDGDKTHRTDMYSRVYLPYRFDHYFTFEPSVGLRETLWYLDEDDESSSDTDWKTNREMYDVKLDAHSSIFRTYEVTAALFGGETVDRIKHAVTPQIIYAYTPEINQDDILYFDSVDRIDRQNHVTYAITNTFTSRAKRSGLANKSNSIVDSSSDQPDYVYAQFCRFKIGQSFDINTSKEGEAEPFSTIDTELELIPFQYLVVRSDAGWSTYDDEFVTHNIAIGLSDTRGDRLYLEHRYNRDENEYIEVDFQFKVTDMLSGYAKYQANLDENQDIATVFGIRYRSQCWSVEFQVTEEPNERRLEAMIHLTGIGGFGSGYDQEKDD